MIYSFKDNKYLKWYFSIIENAQKQLRSKKYGYFELHHIIPKSLGGNDDLDNLVLLTAREHYICHLILIKIVQNRDIYRMVHALIRFKQKVKNSREYSLFRIVLSNYSKGSRNKSFGKIWVHHKIDKSILYITKDEFIERYIDTYNIGLPFQRGGHRDTVWIKKGKSEKLITKSKLDEAINKGWEVGRIHSGDIDHMKKMSNKRHTPVKDHEHSEKLKGRITMFKEGVYKRVDKDLLSKYLNEGWVIQTNPTSMSKKVQIRGISYPSISHAARAIGISYANMCYRLNSNHLKWKDYTLLP